MTSFEAIPPPSDDVSTVGWQTVVPAKPESRTREDLRRAVIIVVCTVLAGAPVGLIWAAVAPHYTVVFEKGEVTFPYLESTKAFIGADGSYTAAMVVAGVLTGLLGWFLARRSGPWTVVALAVGGALAAFVALRVGLIPGHDAAHEALQRRSGSVDLALGTRLAGKPGTVVRTPMAAVFWPAASLVVFLVAALWKPEQVD